MSEKSESAKTTETSSASVDIERPDNDGAKSPSCSDDNNHFFEEKVKERAPRKFPSLRFSVITSLNLLLFVTDIGSVSNIFSC